MTTSLDMKRIKQATSKAVAYYWITRKEQHQRQISNGHSDQGSRSAVTGGAQMDGFIRLFKDIIIEAGISPQYIFDHSSLELPGYFRPTKKWDLLVVKENHLVLALEAKSQVGPSFGNNFNNRTEEAMGSALDLWTAYREGIFNVSTPPFLGYFFMLEDCTNSQSSIGIQEPHFKVFPEFSNSSYAKRYELFCRKLVLERHYTSAVFITSKNDSGIDGQFVEPAVDLSIYPFLRAIESHILNYV